MTLMCVCVLSHIQLFATPGTVARQVALSMEFSRQEYWSGLPFPSPGDLPDPGIEPTSPALTCGFFTTSATWEANLYTDVLFKTPGLPLWSSGKDSVFPGQCPEFDLWSCCN